MSYFVRWDLVVLDLSCLNFAGLQRLARPSGGDTRDQQRGSQNAANVCDRILSHFVAPPRGETPHTHTHARTHAHKSL